MLASYRGHVEVVELLLMYDCHSYVNLTTEVNKKKKTFMCTPQYFDGGTSSPIVDSP